MDFETAKKIYNKYNNATHNQHFVKKEYLSYWSKDNKKILGKKKGDNAYRYYDLNHICVANDIYAIDHHYNEIELVFLRGLYENYPNYIKQVLDRHIALLQRQTSPDFINFTQSVKGGDKLTKGFQSQSGEDAQTDIENKFFGIVKKYIVNEDDSFLDDVMLRTTFILGLTTQFMRTNKSRELLVNAFDPLIEDFEEKNKALDIKIDSEALWKGTIDIMPFLQTFQLNQKRGGIEFIKSDDKFITSDSPVVHIGKKDDRGYALEMKYLYPITPSLCIIYPSGNIVREATTEEVAHINSLVLDNSHLFLFKK